MTDIKALTSAKSNDSFGNTINFRPVRTSDIMWFDEETPGGLVQYLGVAILFVSKPVRKTHSSSEGKDQSRGKAAGGQSAGGKRRAVGVLGLVPRWP